MIAHSKAQERTAATAPLLLGIQPFEDHKTKVKPERASGRRKADFKVTVENKANAPVYVALRRDRARQRVRASASRRPPPRSRRATTVTTTMRVGRPSRSGSAAPSSAGSRSP